MNSGGQPDLFLPLTIFLLLLVGFLFQRQLNEKFPSSPAFEKLAPWLLGTLLVVFLVLLFRGLLAELGWLS